MDKAVLGSSLRVGYFRVGVANNVWEDMKRQWGNCAVTKYRLQLDSPPDGTKGWYTRTLLPETDITVDGTRVGYDMIIYDSAMQKQALEAGTYVKDDAVGVTADSFLEGDEVKTGDGRIFEVKTVTPHYGPASDFHYYTYDLTLLPFRDVTGRGYTASTVQDARNRTKVYLDTYLAQTALGNFLVCYANPEYPLVRVFREKRKDVLFLLGEPDTAPLIGGDHYAYGYSERVPILIQTIDKEGISGTELKWNAETELRRILEMYPLGSVRNMDRRREVDRNLGSTKIYGTQFSLDYTRGTT